jgi:hypothetical protein
MTSALLMNESYNKIVNVKIGVDDLKFDTDDACRRLGFQPDSISDDFYEALIGIFFQLPSKCKISAGYRIIPVDSFQSSPDGIYVENTFLKLNKIITRGIKHSQKLAVFTCTIGEAMEDWSRQKMKVKRHLLGYFIDTIASIVIESAVDYLHRFIGRQMRRQNLLVTNRYSPGYCSWLVSDQHKLFSLLPDNFCGIRLNEYGLMSPIKSMSGIIGIGKNVKYQDYFCDDCNIRDCTYRIKRKQISLA